MGFLPGRGLCGDSTSDPFVMLQPQVLKGCTTHSADNVPLSPVGLACRCGPWESIPWQLLYSFSFQNKPSFSVYFFHVWLALNSLIAEVYVILLQELPCCLPMINVCGRKGHAWYLMNIGKVSFLLPWVLPF